MSTQVDCNLSINQPMLLFRSHCAWYLEGHLTCGMYLRLGLSFACWRSFMSSQNWLQSLFSQLALIFKIILLNAWKHTLTCHMYLYLGMSLVGLKIFHILTKLIAIFVESIGASLSKSLCSMLGSTPLHAAHTKAWIYCLRDWWSSLRLILMGVVWTTCVSKWAWPLVVQICDLVTFVASLNELGSVFAN